MTHNQRFETRKSSAHARSETLARKAARRVKYADVVA